jgi:hypothetical protein
MIFKEFHTTIQESTSDYKPIVYVDMDGVLCDFKSPITMALHKQTYNQVSAKDFDKYFETANVVDYFKRLPKFPETEHILDFILKVVGEYSICSRPLLGYEKQSIYGKNLWIEKNLDEEYLPADRKYVFDKSQFAKTNAKPNILIDDQDDNVDAWNAAGGVAIKFESDNGQLPKLIKELTEALKETFVK